MADGGQDTQTPPARPYHALKAIPDIDAKILAGISRGRSLQSLATEYGVEDMAILNRCQRDFPEAYKAAAKIGYELRMDKREKELESADTNVGVTRADRLLNHARWLAERSCPERWGQKTETHHSGGLTVEIVKFGQVVQHNPDTHTTSEAAQVVDAELITPIHAPDTESSA